MKSRALVTLLLGIVLSGAAVYLVEQRLNSGAEPGPVAAEPSIVLARVVVAKRDLAYGDRLRAEFLGEVDWPAAYMPEGAFKSVGELLGDGKEPRVVLRSMSPGEPVLTSKVSGFGARATLSTKLADGKRAFTIRINDVSGVAGHLLPGDRVDILMTRSRKTGDRNDLVTDVILQNVVVLGIDQLTDDQREKPQLARTATVEVPPKDAQKLALAMQVGSLSLALRSDETVDAVPVSTVGIEQLVGGRDDAGRRASVSGPAVAVRRGTGEVSLMRVAR